jgi:hypothetical protein
MTISIEFLLTESARSAGDVKGHEDVVADFYILDARANLLYYADKFMTESGSYPRIGYQAMIKM